MTTGPAATKFRVAIAGGSGYAGGELLRLLLSHPNAEVVQVTSERHAARPVHRTHPNLRGRTRLRYARLADLSSCDVLFSCLPHGESSRRIDEFRAIGSASSISARTFASPTRHRTRHSTAARTRAPAFSGVSSTGSRS